MPITAHLRLKLRTKTTGPVTDYSQLYNRELVFGNTEKNLFIRDSTGNNIYQFLNVNDNTSSTNTNWSSQQTTSYISSNYATIDHTHNYYDIIDIPKRNIFLSPSGLTPFSDDLIACDSPIVSTNNYIPRWEVNFKESKSGFYNLLVPTDYKNNITKISICYSSDSTGNIEWSINAATVNQGTDVDATSNSYNSIQINSNITQINKFLYADWTGTYDLFGADSIDKLTPILITLDAAPDSSSNCKFYGAKIEYI